MKKCLSILLIMAVVFLGACKKTDTAKKAATTTDDITAAKSAIESGDYATAYKLLQENDSEEAKALRDDFVFLPTSYTENDKKVTTYAYGAKGEVLEENEVYESGFERKIVYTYDAAGRRLSYTVAENDGGICKVFYTYDTDGKLMKVQHEGNFMFEQVGAAVSASSEGFWRQIVFTYDEKGNMLTEEYTYPENRSKKTTCTYDGNGNLLTKEITGNAEGLFEKVYTFTYDAQGKLLTEKEVSADDGSGAETVYTYDASGSLLKTEETTSYDKTIITYDTNGNQISQERISENTRRKTTWTYDENNRLTERYTEYSDSWEKWVYTYDTNGRLVEKEGSSPTSSGKIKYGYDEYGNILLCSIGEERSLKMTWEVYYIPSGVSGRSLEILEMYDAGLFG